MKELYSNAKNAVANEEGSAMDFVVVIVIGALFAIAAFVFQNKVNSKTDEVSGVVEGMNLGTIDQSWIQ